MLFTAVYTGGAPGAPSFQPFVGCIPTSGGGARGETSVKRASAFVPVKPIDRRVVGDGSSRAAPFASSAAALRARGCSAPTPPYAFSVDREPGTTLLGAVSVRRISVGRTVTAVARVAPSVPQSLPVELQLHALCTRVTR